MADPVDLFAAVLVTKLRGQDIPILTNEYYTKIPTQTAGNFMPHCPPPMRVPDAPMRVFGAPLRVFGAQVRVPDAPMRAFDAPMRVEVYISGRWRYRCLSLGDIYLGALEI